MSLDGSIIAHAVRRKSTFIELQAAGVDADSFVGEYKKLWRYLQRMYQNHGSLPSPEQLERRYDWLELPETRKRDLPMLLAELRKRSDYNQLVHIVQDGIDQLKDFDSVDEVRSYLIGSLSAQMMKSGKPSLRDMFSREVSDEMIEEIRRRKSGLTYGLPTGLNKFDAICGGMVPGRMITIIGRTGIGKSFLTLLAVMEAVLSGSKIILYPLEMTLSETAFRLYSMLSYRLKGGDHVLKNMDLASGRITVKKVVRFLHFLEDHYKGQLYVADVGSLSDPYTTDRIEAECNLYQPDGFWVDHILLLKPIGTNDREQERDKITNLARGIKGAAQRLNCIGGSSAQVNREALKTSVFIPRVEHIYNCDGIGHYADQVISTNRKGKYLFYGVVKNRHGPEIGRTRVLFNPNEGQVEEDKNQEDEDED